MNEVWRSSSLQGQFRARWRITNPPEELRTSSRILHISRFEGPSAQAACLTALRAASGDPYGESPDNDDLAKRVSDPLAGDVAITAKLGGASPGRIIDQTLESVSAVSVKLTAAKEKLDTVIFRDKEQLSPDAQKIDQQREEQERKKRQYKGLHIETAATLGEALDLMLITNRYLRAYQKKNRYDWLKQWEQRTARFEGDDAPGPDDQNLPQTA